MSLNYVTITGTFQDGSGAPLSGTATFTPSATVYASGIPVASEDTPVTAVVSSGSLVKSGGGSLQLLATDNAGLTIEGQTGFWYWTVTLTLNSTNIPGWAFFLPHSPTTVDLYTLANTAAGGGGVSFPITVAEGGTGQITQQAALNTLAGAVTNNEVLAGNGTNVTLRSLTSADMPTGVGDKPWQFRPETYGALGNGNVLSDVVINSTTTITSATANFTSGDVGKYIMIHGGNGNSSAPLLTTIASVTNSTTAVLAAAATASQSGCPAVYGTDDTAAINSAFTAAGNYAMGVSGGPGVGYGNFFCEVLFQSKIYVAGTGPTQVGNGNTTPTFNTQFPIPYPNPNGTTRKLIFKITGPADNGYTVYWGATVPQLAGACIVSILPTQPGNSPSGSTGAQSVVGGPAYGTTSINAGFPNAGGGNNGFANVKVHLQGMSIWLPVFTNISAWDFHGLAQARAVESQAMMFAPSGVNGGVQPWLLSLPGNSTFKSTISAGFTFPYFGNNADITASDLTVQGYECAFRVYDHFRADSLRAVYSDVAVNIDRESTNLSHLVSISNMDAEAYNGGLQGPQNSGMSHIDITWSAECSGVAYDVSDPNNTLYGRFHFQDSADQGRGITVIGAAHLKVINDELGPGHWSSPPSVPSSTTAQQNTAWRDAWVSVHCGSGVSVSVINVDGTVTGLTIAASSSQAVRVPSGKNITLTYAGGTPTWDWWLD